MWFINGCIGLGVFNFIMLLLTSLKGAHMFKQRHPGVKVAKSHWSDFILTWVRVAVISILPILNLVLAYQLIFKNDDLCESSYKKVVKKYVKEENDG